MPHNKNDWSCITIFHFIIWMIILSESHFYLKYTITLRDAIRQKKAEVAIVLLTLVKQKIHECLFSLGLEFFTPDSTNDY